VMLLSAMSSATEAADSAATNATVPASEVMVRP
jgi:hypothetical protein